MARPDFFIVGAPKCATTAMYAYLRQHPQIYMPDVKELHYFGSDLVRRRTPPLTEEQYLAYFEGARDEIRVGEASVRYLQSERSAEEIDRFSPDARIIVMLRNPVDMMHAMHGELLFSGMEDIRDFAAALDAEADRAQGQRVPSSTNIIDALLYRTSARFAEQLERYYDQFGTERVHVVIYDDFKADTAEAYRGTLRFLGVDELFSPDFTTVNPSKVARSQFLRNLVASPPWIVRWAARSVTSRRLRKRIYKRLQGWNAKAAPRTPIDPGLRRHLTDEFRPEVERLGRMIGRDLSAWSRL